eukprot:9060296-Pyramimonas_sp.AAC.1
MEDEIAGMLSQPLKCRIGWLSLLTGRVSLGGPPNGEGHIMRSPQRVLSHWNALPTGGSRWETLPTEMAPLG